MAKRVLIIGGHRRTSSELRMPCNKSKSTRERQCVWVRILQNDTIRADYRRSVVRRWDIFWTQWGISQALWPAKWLNRLPGHAPES